MFQSWGSKLWAFFGARSCDTSVQLLVPFYVWPNAATFAELAQAGNVTAVLTGPTNGPPSADDPNTCLYNDLFGRLAQAGVVLIGYVHTSYGQRPFTDVLDEIKLWYSGYGTILSGIFIDEVDNADIEATRAYVSALRSEVNSQCGKRILILNPGTALDASICKLADIVLAFENTLAVWSAESNSSKRGRLPPSNSCKTAVTVHSTGALTYEQVIQQLQKAARLGYSYAYFTDGSIPDPWAGLPTYWQSLVTAVQSSSSA